MNRAGARIKISRAPRLKRKIVKMCRHVLTGFSKARDQNRNDCPVLCPRAGGNLVQSASRFERFPTPAVARGSSSVPPRTVLFNFAALVFLLAARQFANYVCIALAGSVGCEQKEPKKLQTDADASSSFRRPGSVRLKEYYRKQEKITTFVPVSALGRDTDVMGAMLIAGHRLSSVEEQTIFIT
ncbi:hypothetical protein [uncultured Rikenella sp.]|nr:hypothetical protein [uncultured Rikenella sp.]